MLLVRARFRAPMGRLHKGNVHIDSGAGTTVDSYWQRILASKEERAYRLKVVGGERVQQSHSRIVTFWISAVRGGEEFKVETHETILSVPKLDQTRLNSTSSYLVSLRRILSFVSIIHIFMRRKRPALKTSLNLQQRKPSLDGTWLPIAHVPDRSYHQTLNVRWNLFKSCEKWEQLQHQKKNTALLPKNRPIAESRLRSLEKSLSKHEQKADNFYINDARMQ